MKRLFMCFFLGILILLSFCACSDDDASKSDSLTCTHEFVELSRIDPTCTAQGSLVRICSLCAYEERTSIPITDHTYEDVLTSDYTGHWYKALCGCDVKGSFGEHIYEDGDELCDVCLYNITEDKDMISLISEEYGYKLIYKKSDVTVNNEVNKLIKYVKNKTGTELTAGTTQSSFEIVIGLYQNRPGSVSAYDLIKDYATSSISAYVLKFDGVKLIVSVTDDTALKCALSRLYDFVSDSDFLIPKTINELVIFDTAAYNASQEIKTFDKAELDAICTLASISANGVAIDGFSKDTAAYLLDTDIKTGYPTLTVKTTIGGGSAEIVQPTAENGGIGSITVTSKDGKHTMTYTLTFNMKDEYTISSEVITKDGKDGVVTVVLDDGKIPTAEKVKTLLEKYPEMTVTFAMITRKLAGFELSEDGSSYLRDEDGNFILTQTDAQKEATAFWKELLELYPQLEIANHSHTHEYAGEDDTKLYIAYDSNGKQYVYPQGSISAEVFGAAQILRELLGQDSPGFIIPGISNLGGNWSVNSWLPYIRQSGAFVGSRLTSASTNAASMVMMPDDFKTENLRWNGKAFMIRYFNMSTTESGSFHDQSISAEDAIAAGISHATDFIDAAMEKGGWACFCLHDIIDVGSSGTHPIYTEQADALFAYINELGKNGTAWVATYGDAVTYYTEWASAKTNAICHNDNYIDFSLTCEEKNEHFDMPLTVKLTVPETWESCELSYQGTVTELDIQTADDGSKFVYVNIAPETTATVSPII